MNPSAPSSARPILLHTCCGPCLLGVAPILAGQGFAVHAYFNNPNIHGLLEFRRRLGTFLQTSALLKLPQTHCSDYGLEPFMAMWAENRDRRCLGCYRMRLQSAAEEAARLGIGAFTTTLLISPHQDIDAVNAIGHEIAAQKGLEFVSGDFRQCHQAALDQARKHSLYRQQYCGCIFSEYDRYKNSGKYVSEEKETGE